MLFNLLCAGESGANSWIMPVVLVGMIVLMLLITYFPNKKKKKEAQQMMASVRVGKKIKTIGGFVGEIVGMDEKNGTIDVNVGTKEAPVIVVLDKGAIYTVLNPDIPVKQQTEVKADENEVPVAVTAEDMAADEKEAEKAAEKQAKKEAKKKEKLDKAAQKDADAAVNAEQPAVEGEVEESKDVVDF